MNFYFTGISSDNRVDLSFFRFLYINEFNNNNIMKNKYTTYTLTDLCVSLDQSKRKKINNYCISIVMNKTITYHLLQVFFLIVEREKTHRDVVLCFSRVCVCLEDRLYRCCKISDQNIIGVEHVCNQRHMAEGYSIRFFDLIGTSSLD